MESARCFCWTCSSVPNGTSGHVSRIFISKNHRSANSDGPPCSSDARRCLRPPQPPSHRTPWTWLGCRVGCQLQPTTARHPMASSPGQSDVRIATSLKKDKELNEEEEEKKCVCVCTGVFVFVCPSVFVCASQDVS